MTSNETQVNVRSEDVAENWRNAVRAVEAELGKTLSTGRGRAAVDEITAEDVLNELAIAYTGIDLADVEEPTEHETKHCLECGGTIGRAQEIDEDRRDTFCDDTCRDRWLGDAVAVSTDGGRDE